MPEPDPPQYTASLTVHIPQGVEYFRGRPFFRVRIVVDEVTGFLDTNLFVHQRRMLPGSQHRDEFIGVAGPVDLADFDTVPDARFFLRSDTIDMLLESHNLYNDLVTSVTDGVKELIEGMRRLDQMQTDQTIIIT
jgi:hypothetical protein